MSSTSENKFKYKSLLGVLIIGIIGSGLWDLLFKRIVFFLGDTIVNIATYFNSNYLNHIYNHVGNGSGLIYTPSIFILVGIIGLMLIMTLRGISYINLKFKTEPNEVKKNSLLIDFIFKSKSRAISLTLILFFPIIVLYTDTTIVEVSNVRAIAKIERELDILRPYLDDKSYYTLKSKYRQIDSKQKLIETLDLLNGYALKNNVELPAKKLFGID